MNPARRKAARTGNRAAPYRRHISVLAAALLVAACVPAAVERDDGRGPVFGTLQTMAGKARLERSEGIRAAHLQIFWDRYETREGHFSSRYRDSVRSSLERLQQAGSLIEVSLGLHHAPSWLFDEYPEAAYVDQEGNRLTDAPNMVFSQTVREKAQRYVERVDRDIGLDNFWAIRVGVSGTGEFGYPSGPGDNSYWAFDANAQSPAPGWKPGQRDYQGTEFTEAQVRAWYDWYLRALSGAVNWQIEYYRSLRYGGFLKVLVAGSGYYPRDYKRAVQRHLDESAGNRLVALGVGFFRTLGQIHHRHNVQIVPTSLVDGTGKPRNNGCSPEDRHVNVLSPPDRVHDEWSSMRWVSRIARQHGFTLLSGESAGTRVSPYYPGVMSAAARQMDTCGLRSLMWAFDSNLYDSTPGSSLADYSAMISRFD
jgi:hypothetical protein